VTVASEKIEEVLTWQYPREKFPKQDAIKDAPLSGS
jgi:hypothetical protein